MCEPWFCVGLGWLPISVGVMLASSMLIPYCIAVGLNHVPAGFPYISDTGTQPPESCVFGQLLNITAALAFATIYVRYKQVEEYSDNIHIVRSLNRISLIIGGLAAFGMSLVANFQETNVIMVHLIGAFMCFGLGIVYGYMQSVVSYKMQPHHSTLFVCRARVFFSTLAMLALISTSVFTSIAQAIHQKEDPSKKIYEWAPTDDGFGYHITATSSEWCLALAFLAYFFTFIREFQKLAIVAEIKRSADYVPIPGDNISNLLT